MVSYVEITKVDADLSLQKVTMCYFLTKNLKVETVLAFRICDDDESFVAFQIGGQMVDAKRWMISNEVEA